MKALVPSLRDLGASWNEVDSALANDDGDQVGLTDSRPFAQDAHDGPVEVHNSDAAQISPFIQLLEKELFVESFGKRHEGALQRVVRRYIVRRI